MTPIFARQPDPERAFERLYEAHVHDVYRYSLMVLRNRDDAEDVAQTTFLKAYRAFQRGEQPRHPRQWLITIAHNTCRTRLRDEKRRPQEVQLDDRLAASVADQEQEGVDPKELLRALGELTFNQRAALVMRELEGRSYAEIAEVLELTPNAVETVLFRARRALREQLEGTLGCGEAELALSRDLDGRLAKVEKSQLRAHLRACSECASLARRQRAQRAVLRSLGPLPLPSSLASWGGGAAAGTGVAAKLAAVVAAGAAAAGVAYEAADAVPEPVTHDRAALVAVAAPADHPLFSPLKATTAAAERVARGHAAAPRRRLPNDDAHAATIAAAQPDSQPALEVSAGTSNAGSATASAPAVEVATVSVRVPSPPAVSVPAAPAVPAVPAVPEVPVQVPASPTLPVQVQAPPEVSVPLP